MEVYSSTEALDSVERDEKDTPDKKEKPSKKKPIVLLSILLCVAALTATTATFLLTKDSKNSSDCERRVAQQNKKTQGLYKTIQDKYIELHSSPLVKNADGVSTIAPLYLNFTPTLYKVRTQAAQELLTKLNGLSENGLELSKEENITFELYRRFLVNTFGAPYENNYEIGDWLLGPNIFCWQESCALLSSLGHAFTQIDGKTVEDIELMVDFIRKCSEGYKQRTRNLKNGILAGIVLPDVACRAGLQNYKALHVHVAKNGPNGIFKEDSIAEIVGSEQFQNIMKDKKLEEKWKKKYKVSIMQHLKDSLLNYVGKSLHDFLRYLEDDYSTHCPSSDISSGFASIPLPYVYNNSVPDISQPTTGRLPGGGKYNGKHAYLIMLSYFTTYNITPEEVDQLANEKLKEIFPQIVKIAKTMTNEKNDSKAIEKFRSLLESDKFFYPVENENKYPEPYMRCYDDETAKQNCPERWKAMTRWLESAEENVNQLKKKVQLAFYVTGDKRILPVCDVRVRFDFSPANPYHSYSEGSSCAYPAEINIPFFLERPGPNYEEITVMAHESYPGHHLEVQGVQEHFSENCDKLRQWITTRNYFAAFSEGWATYIEKDVADVDMKLYKTDMQRYGMLKHQILAALRAKVDVGVHYMGMKRREAVALYEKYALDTSDGIQKEITRLQSGPGQGTAYLVGEAKFSEYRKKAEKKLGKKFNVRDFHYEILRKGELPMIDVGNQIEEYIQRKLKEN